MDDDIQKKAENLPLKETPDEGDKAEKSPSSPLSQYSSTQSLVNEGDDDHPITSHALSPKSLEKLKLKFKKQIFGDDYDSAELETSSDDEQDNAVVCVKRPSPPRSASKELEELKLKLKKDIFGEDYDSHDYDTTEDDDSTTTTITSETTLKSFHGDDIRETTPSSSVAKQPKDTDRETSSLPERITLADAAAVNLAKRETKPSSTDAAQPTSAAEQADK